MTGYLRNSIRNIGTQAERSATEIVQKDKIEQLGVSILKLAQSCVEVYSRIAVL